MGARSRVPAFACALIALILPLASIHAQSSTSRGTWTVGGSASFSSSLDRGNDRRHTRFQLSPDLGLFVVDNLLVSANLRFGWGRTEDVGSDLTLGIGPGISYYVSSFSRTVLPYATVRSLLQTIEFSPASGTVVIEQSQRDLSWTAGVGVLLLFNPHVGLAIEAGYSDRDVSVSYPDDTGLVELSNSVASFGLQLGLRVLFP